VSEPSAPLVGDRRVLGPLHLRVLEVVAAVERGYEGELGLRLEGGTALAAYHLRHPESADPYEVGLDRAGVIVCLSCLAAGVRPRGPR
jgi:hypothetical protein